MNAMKYIENVIDMLVIYIDAKADLYLIKI